ncbi:MAG: SDR family NAD(P)-dependent oxidoreductase [Aureliella sp.]
MAKRIFSGKRVILTGASSGIGWYLAAELVRAGAMVVITARRGDRLQKLRQSFGNPQKRLIALPGDITEPGHRQRLIERTVDELGGIDIVINNAGSGAIGNFEDATPERLRRVFEVDFFAAAELTRLALPHLRCGNQPAVCVVSSVLGHRGVPGKSEYCAAKFALRGWAESLRVELQPRGVDVLTISPSTTSSEFFGSLIDTAGAIVQRPSRFGSQSPERVAHSIVRALRGRKRDTILSPGGKALVWLSQLAPRLTDRLLLRYGMPATC